MAVTRRAPLTLSALLQRTGALDIVASFDHTNSDGCYLAVPGPPIRKARRSALDSLAAVPQDQSKLQKLKSRMKHVGDGAKAHGERHSPLQKRDPGLAKEWAVQGADGAE
jgi:hypothetical protein